MHILRLLGGGNLACPDRPDRFVGNHHLGDLLGRYPASEPSNWRRMTGQGLPSFTLGQQLAHADDRDQPRGQMPHGPSC